MVCGGFWRYARLSTVLRGSVCGAVHFLWELPEMSGFDLCSVMGVLRRFRKPEEAAIFS
jgi:hypothetical protein